MVYVADPYIKKNRATDSGVKPLALESEDLQGLSLKFLDDDVGNFLITYFQPFHFSCKIGF